jgi:CCR4-NOT transcription complex subunit 1
VLSNTFLLDALSNLGPKTTLNLSRLRSIVGAFTSPCLDESSTAKLIALIAGALQFDDAEFGIENQRLTVQSVTPELSINKMETSQWRLDVLVRAFSSAIRNLSARGVAAALDNAEIVIKPHCGSTVFQVFAALIGRPFPSSVLSRIWCHREQVQLPLLEAGAKLLCHNSGLILAEAEPAGGLVGTLLQLSRLGHSVSCSATLSQAVIASPDATLLALCTDTQVCKLKKHLLTTWMRNEEVFNHNFQPISKEHTHHHSSIAANIWQSGHEDVLTAVLSRQVINLCETAFLIVSDVAAATFVRGVIDSVGACLLNLFKFDARLALSLAVVDADCIGDTSKLAALLKQALNDATNELEVSNACLEFAQGMLRGQWKAATYYAVIDCLRINFFSKDIQPGMDYDTWGPVEQTYTAILSLPSYAAFNITDRAVRTRHKSDSFAQIVPRKADMLLLNAKATFRMIGVSIAGCKNYLVRGMQLCGGGPLEGMSRVNIQSTVYRFDEETKLDSTSEVLQVDDSRCLTGNEDDLAKITPRVDNETLATRVVSSNLTSATINPAPLTRSASDGTFSIAELMPAACEIQPAVAPSEIVLDCVHMVFNNVSHSNLEAKVKDIAPLLHEEHFGWFANYLVVKRISTQPNFHSLYLAFLEKLGADESHQNLLKCVISAVFHNIAKLLRSCKITTSTSERSLLKNLGSWLGQITLAKNRPILQRQLDVKELLYQGYESGRLIAICPFVAKILEGAKSSIVFRPPNPWLMGLMAVLRDLYDIEELKMNIKFEIEVLSKHLGIKLDEVTGPVTLLSRSPPVKSRSPDFNVKRTAESIRESPLGQGLSANLAQRTSNLSQHQPQQRQKLHSGGFNSLTRDKLNPTDALVASQSKNVIQGGGTSSVVSDYAPQLQQGGITEQTVIPNLASYITVSAQVASGPAGAALRRVAPVAVDRAIREIIQPVVERSVTIACITTKDLVAKDFATESDENRIRKAAQLMVSNLAGSLALVTCKEPLRVSIAKHLRTLLQLPGSAFSGSDQHEQHAVQTCAAENLDLGCMLIEKAATEKAIRDVDEALAPSLKGREKRFDQSRGHVETIGSYGISAGRYPAALPEPLRPKSGLLAHQFFVYEAFQPVPRQTHHQQSNQQTTTQQHPQNQRIPPHMLDSASNPSLTSTSSYHAPVSNGACGGAAVLSLTAQQAAAERSSISIAELMDAYRSATAKLDAEFAALTNKMQGVAAEVSFAQLRNHPVAVHVGELLLAAARVERPSRDDAALAIAQSTFKAMCEHRALEPPVRLETLAIVLAAVADISAHLVRDEVANWIAFLPAHSEVDRCLHAHVLVRLLGVELLNVAELDAYLARNMDGGHSQPWLDITLAFVELSVAKYRLATFPAHLQRIARVLETLARQPHPPPALRRLVAALSADQQSRVHMQQQHQLHKHTKIAQPRPVSSQTAAQQLLHQPKDQHQQSNTGLEMRIAGAGNAGTGGVKNAQELHTSFGRAVSATSAARELRLASLSPKDPIGAREQVTGLLEHWIRVWNESPGSEKAYARYLALLQQHAVPRSETSTERFVRLATIICVESCVESRSVDGTGVLSYSAIDAYAKLLILLVKYAVSDPNASASAAGAPQRLDLLNRVLSTLTRTLIADYDATIELGGFDQRPYFRLFLNLLQDLNVPDPVLDSSNARVLAAFATMLHAVQPAVAPGFAFAWLELVSHRMFMPNLLTAKNQKGWTLMHRLLINLFVFLEPYLRKVQLSDGARLLYKGALRVLLVLLHDFPEFLSDYHFSFCDVIPSSCIQLRNLFLSAFPRSMRLPDPFTPNLKVDLLPEISQPPRILSNCAVALDACSLRESLDEYLQTRHPISFLLDLPRKLHCAHPDNDLNAAAYNVPLINSLVVHVGITAISQLHTKSGNAQQPITHSTPMDVFQHLMNNLDSEGRYFLMNAIANQLRYPNNHTHYFSCVLIYLFAEATSEYNQEQVTRVLLERLIVHRPHPWGLLITFIELIKNPRYSFWSHEFTHCATEIERVFESVARSCMGPGHHSNVTGDTIDQGR